MAIISISDRALDAEGNGVSGATVELYAVNVDGTIGTLLQTTSTASTGKYTFNPQHTTSPSGKFAVKVISGADVRWRYPDVKLQIELISGPNGDAPLATNSISSSQLRDAAVTDSKIGTRQPDEAISSPSTPSGPQTLTTLLSWMAKVIKLVTGEASWYAVPSNGSLREKILDGQNTPRIVSAISLSTPAPVAEEVRIVQSGTDKGVWKRVGTSWVEVANTEGASGSGTTANAFANVRVGSTTLTADSSADTLTLVAGTNITLTPSATSDSVTISAASGGSSGSSDASTIKGNDADLYPYFSGMAPGSSGAPGLTTGPWKIQAGSVVAVDGGSTYAFPLSGPVNGIVTVIVTDGDYGAHSGTPLTFAAEGVTLGSSPVVGVRVLQTNGALYHGGGLRMNYIVVHW